MQVLEEDSWCFPEIKDYLFDLEEDEVAVLLASAIVNILLLSNAENFLPAMYSLRKFVFA